MSDVIHSVDMRRRDWIAAVNERDVAAYLNVLHPEIVWLPPGQDAIVGHAAFAEWVAPFFKAYRYDFTVEDAVVRVSGDFAVERGRFVTELKPTDSEKAMLHTGSYLAIWRRDPDGRWMMERYVDGMYLED